MWYSSFDGIIGVYDVNNINSRNNLDLWFREAVGLQKVDQLPWSSGSGVHSLKLDLTMHPEKHLSGRMIPVLIVANKQDILMSRGLSTPIVAHKDLLVSAMDDFEMFSDGLKCAMMKNFLDCVIAEAKSQRKTSLSPSSSFDASGGANPVKLGLGETLSPFLDSAKSGRRKNLFETSEVRLKIDF